MRRVALTVNGMRHELELEPRELLVYVLRERLGLTGTNVGCDTRRAAPAPCCSNGESVKSCTVLGVQADGHEITTIEGLAARRRAPSGAAGVPRAPRAAVRLLHAGHDHGRGRACIERGPATDEAAIRHALEGNLCRCTGYHNIVRAVAAAAGVSVLTATEVEPALGRARRVTRKEDATLLRGAGTYVDNLTAPGADTWPSSAARIPHAWIKR